MYDCVILMAPFFCLVAFFRFIKRRRDGKVCCLPPRASVDADHGGKACLELQRRPSHGLYILYHLLQNAFHNRNKQGDTNAHEGSLSLAPYLYFRHFATRPLSHMGTCYSRCSFSVSSRRRTAEVGTAPASGNPRSAGNPGHNNGHPQPLASNPTKNGEPSGGTCTIPTGVSGLRISPGAKANDKVPKSPTEPAVSHSPAGTHPSSPSAAAGARTAVASPDDQRMPPLQLHPGSPGSVPTPRSSLSTSQRRFGPGYLGHHSDSSSDKLPRIATPRNNHKGKLGAYNGKPAAGDGSSTESASFASAQSKPESV